MSRLKTKESIMFKEWKGLNRRLYQELKSFTIYDIKQVLLDASLDGCSPYYMPVEQIKYELLRKYFNEVSDGLDVTLDCSCGTTNTFTITENDLVYKGFEEQVFESNGYTFITGNPNLVSEESIETIQNAVGLTDRIYLEMIFSMNDILKDGESLDMSIAEIDSMLREFGIKEFNRLYDAYFENRFKFEIIKSDCECGFCGLKQEYRSDDIPDEFFKVFL